MNDKVSLLYMLTNGIQQTEEFNDFKSSHVAAVMRPMRGVTWTVNGYFGREEPDNGAPGGPNGAFRIFDTYITVTPTATLSLGLDANYTTRDLDAPGHALSLQGVGAYARQQLTSASSIAVRYERLDDEGLFAGIGQVLHEVTLTTEYRVADGFMLRGESRRDWSDQAFFPARSGPADRRRQQTTVLVGVVWVVGTRSGAW